MFCTHCGTAASNSARFCRACGQALTIGPVHVGAMPPTAPRPVAAVVTGTVVNPATFLDRTGAFVLDFLIVTGAGIVVVLLAAATTNEYTQVDGFITLLMLTGNWLYYAGMESSQRQATFGKEKIGLRVVSATGQRISFGRASVRFWGKLLSGLLFGCGYLLALFTSRKQTLHDLMAGAFVVRPVPDGL